MKKTLLIELNYFEIILSSLEKTYFRTEYDFKDLKKRIDETFMV